MTESQKNIAQLEEKLPHLKEKIVAVALLFAMAIAMMTTATFAWLTLSKNPAVSGVKTAIAANGNLEIALVGPEGAIPAVSKAGDSNRDLIERNITWGNLVNLSDPQYGLENLVLRPARLNEAGLLTNPLYGADYGADGRVEKLNPNFSYAKWVLPVEDIPGYFEAVTNYYGVKAISSTTIEAVGAAETYYKMLNDTISKNLAASNTYLALATGNSMKSLATLMGVYMTARMNPDDAGLSNPTVVIEDVENIAAMYETFLVAMDQEAEAMAGLLNLQLFLKNGAGNYQSYTADMVYAATDASLKAAGLKLTNLDQFKKDRDTIASDLEKLNTIVADAKTGGYTSVAWKDSGLNNIVNNLVNVGACTIGADNTPISSIGASNAIGYLSGTQEAKITNGILYRFEERTGAYIEVKGLGISATVKRGVLTVPATVKANITTTAPRDYNLFDNDRVYTESLNTGDYVGGKEVADDTYGLAIDLWVRTNAEGSYLTLEGNVLTETKTERATGKDAGGNTVELWTLTRTVEITDEETGATSTETVTFDLYQIVNNDNGTPDDTTDDTVTWYNAASYTEFTLNDGETPTAKMVEVEYVIGYEGENRVWEDNALISASGISTTQGGGSNYTFYYDAPDDMERTLRLLDSMKVVFYGEDGKIMATAYMDTAHGYETPGKVIVPLVLSAADSVNLGTDASGNEILAITSLAKNTPTRVTALLYLDGTNLTNEDVLAINDIQGQLNIQFGSTANLSSVRNEKLEMAYLDLSASLDKTEFDYDTATEKMITRVTLNVGGTEPNSVRAHFVRKITATQGVREEAFVLTKNADGAWVYDYEFTSPGEYLLRSVEIDGVEYELNQPKTVVVHGFTISSIEWDYAYDTTTVMTASGSVSTDVRLKFATDDLEKMPSVVSGRFMRTDGTVVSVSFMLNPTTQTWSGTATFRSSGEYTLLYLVLDGDYVAVDASMQKIADVYLGIKAEVRTTAMQLEGVSYGSDGSLQYTYDATRELNLPMQVELFDDNGNELTGLSVLYDVSLTYAQQGAGATMGTALKWNQAAGCYEGEFPVEKPGIFKYSQVTIGSNAITSATEAPTFTVISPEPPEYVGFSTDTYQFSPENNAVMKVTFTNAEAASVTATVRNTTTGETKTVESANVSGITPDGSNETTFSILLPTYENAEKEIVQDGHWELLSVALSGVYDDEQNFYGSNNPMVFDMTSENNVTKVVSTVYVTFAEGQSQDFGVDADGNKTAAFMAQHTVSGLNVILKDFEGQALTISDVKLVYHYDGQSETYGGYSGTNTIANPTYTTISLDAVSENGTKFTQSTAATLFLAGGYTPVFSFTANGKAYTSTTNSKWENLPAFTVSSKAPTVTISSVSINPSNARYYLTSTPTSLNVITGLSNKKIDDYNAVVYMYVAAQSGTLDQEQVVVMYPTVTLGLSGVPTTHQGVTMVFPGTNNNESMFTFEAAKETATSKIGAGTDGVFNEGLLGIGSGVETWPKFYPAGKQTVNQITVTYGNEIYTVNLSHDVTINNPLISPEVTYKINDSTYTGAVPGNVRSEDGETITVTLPTIGAWTENRTSTTNGTFVVQSGYPSTRNVYTEEQKPSGCSTTTYYTPYIETTTVSKATGSTTTWVTTHQITGWKVGNTVYLPGETITVTGNQTITAVITKTDGPKTTVSSTTTRTEITYTANGDESTTNPGGTKVDSVENSSTDVVS